MIRMVFSFLKFIAFFLGWALTAAFLPISSSENPAIWRLWAEIMPLFAIIAFTIIFWLGEKRAIKLHLFDNPGKGILIGIIAGGCWIFTPTLIMYAAQIIHFENIHPVELFHVWLLGVFLNAVMQELLVRGYLYQMLKQKHNIIVAMIATTTLFTLLHGGAFEAGVIPVLNVFTMSLLMTAVLEYTNSLIAPTIMHFLWNGTGALVLGGVSLADDYPHLLTITFSGSQILSGGICKIEGSIVVLFINVILIALFVNLKRIRPISQK